MDAVIALLASTFHTALYGGPYGMVALAIVVSGLVLLAAQRAMTVPRSALIRRRVQSQMTAAERAQRRQAAPGLAELLGHTRAWLERRLGETKSWAAVALIVDRAGWRMRTADAILISTAAGLVLATIAVVAGGSTILAFLALMLGVWAPFAYAVMKGRKRDRAFDEQLPDVLLALSSSLKVGHSFDHSLQNVAEDGRPPASEEFARVLQELRLGRPIEAALADLGKRVRSEHLAFVRTAVTIQREVGGSLAGLFETVAETVRERQQLARKLRSLTAMGRMSAAVLVCLPFVAALGLSVTSPGYMRPLWETQTGRTLILVGFVMIVIGALMLKRIVSPKR